MPIFKSKYKGSEIDNKLDEINTIKADLTNKTEIGEVSDITNDFGFQQSTSWVNTNIYILTQSLPAYSNYIKTFTYKGSTGGYVGYGYYNSFGSFVISYAHHFTSGDGTFTVNANKDLDPNITYYPYIARAFYFLAANPNGVTSKTAPIATYTPAANVVIPSSALTDNAVKCYFGFSAVTTVLPDNLLLNYDNNRLNLNYGGVNVAGLTLPVMAKSSNVITVGKDKCDFTTIQAAVNHAQTIQSATNPVTIIVHPGVYSRFSCYGADMYISIIGTNKYDCIIKDTTGLYASPPINMMCYGLLKGFTVISTHDDITVLPQGNMGSYALHCDFGTGVPYNLTIEDCIMTSYQTAAIGAGLRPNSTLKIKDCELYSYINSTFNTSQSNQYPALLVHGSVVDTGANQNIIVDNVRCYTSGATTNYAVNINKYKAGNTVNALIRNSTFYSVEGGIGVNFDCTLDKLSWGNNIPTLNATYP